MRPLSSPAQRSAAIAACLGAAAVAALFAQAGALYDGFPQPAGAGFTVPVRELAFQALYVAFGVPFVALLGWGLWQLGGGALLGRGFARLARHPRAGALLALLVVLSSTGFRFAVLERSVVTDDEQAYVFIARTLLQGGVVNPLPEDAQFLANQFVLVKQRGWYGMYPIGHPLVLALGLLTGTLDVIVCLLAGVTAVLTFSVARRTVGRRRAAGAVALLALSPHFTWSYATLVSQTTTGFALMAGLAAWLAWSRRGEPRWLAASGLAFGLAVLSRPMPGVLFAALAGAVTLGRLRAQRRSVVALAPFAATLALGFAGVALVNWGQTGSPFTSPYQQAYQGTYVLAGERGTTALSLFGAAWRENFWLFGWPLSLAPLAFARPRRGAVLLWAPVVAELVYRVLVPKTVLSTTGPVYVLEAVPVLCVLASDGLARLGLLARRARWRPGLVPSLVAASVTAAVVLFAPVQVRSIQQGVFAYGEVWRLLEAAKAPQAVIFVSYLLTPDRGAWWAFYPPTVSPTFDDDHVFVKWPRDAADPEAEAVRFARAHFPGRPAFLYLPEVPGRLVPLPGAGGTQP